MIYYDLLSFIMACCGLWWFIMMYYDLLWLIMMCYGVLLWFIYGLLWLIMCLKPSSTIPQITIDGLYKPFPKGCVHTVWRYSDKNVCLLSSNDIKTSCAAQSTFCSTKSRASDSPCAMISLMVSGVQRTNRSSIEV